MTEIARSPAPLTPPEPLTPADCDISNWPGIMIDIARLQKSRAWLYCKTKPHLNLAFHLFNLWMAAWHEVPAASLENDDDVLADKAKCKDVEHWLSIKEDALRGFQLCDDGRLYHDVIAAKALECWLQKLGARISSGHGNAARHGNHFDDAYLREQLGIARAKLFSLDPHSEYFTRKPGPGSASAAGKEPKAKKAPLARRTPAKTPTTAIPAGADSDAGGIATKRNGTEGKGIDVGGAPLQPPVGDELTGAGAAASAAGEAPKTGQRSAQKAGALLQPAFTLVLPDWLPPDDWARFMDMRMRMGKSIPFTEAAALGILRKLEKLRDEGQDPAAMLDASVRNGWRDVFAVKGASVGRMSTPSTGKYTGAATAVFGHETKGAVIDA